MNKSLIIASVAAVTALSSVAMARGGWGHGGKGRGMGHGPGARFMQALDLTEAQKTQVQKLRAEMFERTEETREALEAKREAMHALWTTASPDRDAILAQHEQMDALRKVLREAKVDFRLAVHSLLSAEQVRKLESLPPPKPGRHGPGGCGEPDGFGGGPGGF